ncbi:aprataxin and PNK-like factor isoform X2 [Pseudophryne corroboree]|uniref:aprataxin and PNK-like factor isoform X2 n=1 Tax=Pseudophryne corroboree TaxID=495146 RepID=UPI003081FE57
MSGYRLKATDGSGIYTLPKGETVIGRGPFLAVHVNPCFYQASNKSEFVPLERNEWSRLHPGDSFSLLPDKYSFQVIIEDLSKEETARNSNALDEDCALNNKSPCSPIASGSKVASEKPSSPVRDRPKPTVSSPSASCSTEKIHECIEDLSSAVGSKDDEEKQRSAQRKRVLPTWMLQGDLPIQILPSAVIKAGKKKRKITERNVNAAKTIQSLVEEKEMASGKLEDEENSMKNNTCGVGSEVSPGTSASSLPGRSGLGISHKLSVIDKEEEDLEADICDTTPDLSPAVHTSGTTSPSAKQHQPSNSKAAGNDDLSLSPGSPPITQQTPKTRTPCIYGEKCYRKNPVHFQEFSHPGDSDYVENGSQDDSDDRPECPYGTSCYRKNPQHKLEYKHTRPPARSALDDDSDNDGNPNDYDLEDSFIDDDEDFDNTDEDSDWKPDSQEKDSEDVKLLLKEAKRFVKRKR